MLCPPPTQIVRFGLESNVERISKDSFNAAPSDNGVSSSDKVWIVLSLMSKCVSLGSSSSKYTRSVTNTQTVVKEIYAEVVGTRLHQSHIVKKYKKSGREAVYKNGPLCNMRSGFSVSQSFVSLGFIIMNYPYY